jgi:hypothetical protein
MWLGDLIMHHYYKDDATNVALAKWTNGLTD